MCDHAKILVTGGAGFIGSHIVDRLIDEDSKVTVLDNLRGGQVENIQHHLKNRNFRFIRGDIRNFRLLKNLITDTDAVIHQAAQVSVPESNKDPILTNNVNVNGTLNLLKVCVDFNVKRFVYASSCAIYGNPKALPIREDCPTKPTSPYGVSKLAAEEYVRIFYDIYGLETVCLRYFNVYGPRQAYNQYSGVITQFTNCLEKNLPLEIFGDGQQTRDFIHVQDVVESNLLALRTEGIGGEAFNIATALPTTINQLADMLLQLTEKTNLKIKHARPRKGDIRYSVADISKAENKLGYKPRISLKDGLTEFTKSLRSQ
jgi:UDP-glucose 4-epimerase